MRFTLTIESHNAAFADSFATDYAELRLCIHSVSEAIRVGRAYGDVLDSNGNRCGTWGIDDEPEPECSECGETFERGMGTDTETGEVCPRCASVLGLL